VGGKENKCEVRVGLRCCFGKLLISRGKSRKGLKLVKEDPKRGEKKPQGVKSGEGTWKCHQCLEKQIEEKGEGQGKRWARRVRLE